jgi:hypothetical protein
MIIYSLATHGYASANRTYTEADGTENLSYKTWSGAGQID